MIVYRLEDKKGRGPFAYRDGLPSINHNIRNHNEPSDMAKNGQASVDYKTVRDYLNRKDMVFAWNSLELMADFCRFPREADRAGFYVIAYELGDNPDIVKFDDGQVIFSRDSANAIGGFWLSRALNVCFNEDD